MLFTDECLEEQTERLSKRKSPSIIFNDSIQEMGFDRYQFLDFKKRFNNKIFIWISQATPNGRHPSNNLGQFIRHSSDVKIHIMGYMAFVTSRYGSKKPYVIWKDGAQDYYGADMEQATQELQKQEQHANR